MTRKHFVSSPAKAREHTDKRLQALREPAEQDRIRQKLRSRLDELETRHAENLKAIQDGVDKLGGIPPEIRAEVNQEEHLRNLKLRYLLSRAKQIRGNEKLPPSIQRLLEKHDLSLNPRERGLMEATIARMNSNPQTQGDYAALEPTFEAYAASYLAKEAAQEHFDTFQELSNENQIPSANRDNYEEVSRKLNRVHDALGTINLPAEYQGVIQETALLQAPEKQLDDDGRYANHVKEVNAKLTALREVGKLLTDGANSTVERDEFKARLKECQDAVKALEAYVRQIEGAKVFLKNWLPSHPANMQLMAETDKQLNKKSSSSFEYLGGETVQTWHSDLPPLRGPMMICSSQQGQQGQINRTKKPMRTRKGEAIEFDHEALAMTYMVMAARNKNAFTPHSVGDYAKRLGAQAASGLAKILNFEMGINGFSTGIKGNGAVYDESGRMTKILFASQSSLEEAQAVYAQCLNIVKQKRQETAIHGQPATPSTCSAQWRNHPRDSSNSAEPATTSNTSALDEATTSAPPTVAAN